MMTDATSTKYGHFSEIDPAFAKVKDAFDAQMSQVSPLIIGLEGFKQAMIEGPKFAPLPDGMPELGKDIETSDSEVQVRDGTKIGIRLYKTKGSKPKNVTLYFKMHGGGFTIGSHEIEEAENRSVAALPNVVVVSVDYRLALEFKFSYALHDSLDVLK